MADEGSLVIWRPSREAVIRYTVARTALDANGMAEYQAGIRHETPQFLVLNRAVGEAAKGVPWWRRWWIDQRVARRLGYWEVVR